MLMRQSVHPNTGKARYVLSRSDQPTDSYTFATSAAVHRPSASPGSLLGMQNLGPQVISRQLKFQKQCGRTKNISYSWDKIFLSPDARDRCNSIGQPDNLNIKMNNGNRS